MVQKGYNGNDWVNMVLCKAVKDYLKEGGTTNIEIDEFLDFYSLLSKGQKNAPYECYSIWEKLVRHSRTLFKRDDCFHFDKCLKDYLRFASEELIVH